MDFTIDRSASATTGVVSPSLSVTRVPPVPAPSSLTVAVFATWTTPSGTGSSTRTENTAVAAAPTARSPITSSQVVGGATCSLQDQLPLDVASSKVVVAGTVSTTTTPVAAWSPALATRA